MYVEYIRVKEEADNQIRVYILLQALSAKLDNVVHKYCCHVVYLTIEKMMNALGFNMTSPLA